LLLVYYESNRLVRMEKNIGYIRTKKEGSLAIMP
jgi:hypothetical protein